MKVLHVVGGLDFGGIEKWLSNVFKESNNVIDNYVLSMHPTKKKIVPFLNIPLDNIYFTNKNNVLYRIISLINVIRLEKPDVVHCHAGYSSGLYALVSILFRVKNVVVHSHSDRRVVDEKASTFKLMYIYTMKSILSKLNINRLAVSEGSGLSLFKSEYKISYCGVPAYKKNISISALDEIVGNGNKIVFHIGRYTEAKNFPFILELLNKFKLEENIFFAFIGGELDVFSTMCKNAGVNNVIFLGQIDDPTSIMNKYGSLFILPSKWEGLPLSAVEAQLSGLNCILSDNVTREVDIGTAIFCNLNVDVWFDMIHVNMKNKNKKLIDTNKFSIKSNVNDLIGVYKNV